MYNDSFFPFFSFTSKILIRYEIHNDSLSLALLSVSSWPHTAKALCSGTSTERERDCPLARLWTRVPGVGVFAVSKSRSRSLGIRLFPLRWRGRWSSSRVPCCAAYETNESGDEDADEFALGMSKPTWRGDACKGGTAYRLGESTPE